MRTDFVERWKIAAHKEKLKEIYKEDPEELLKVDKYEAGLITTRLDCFMTRYMRNSKKDGYVIGLSGGIDSSAAAYAAVHAVGKDKVLGLLIPSVYTSQEHTDDGLLVAKNLGIGYAIVDKELFEKEIETDNAIETDIESKINTILDAKGDKKLLIGNDHARTRMKILRRTAQKYNCLVLGTTNLTETLLGYATIAGDGYKGVDIEPLQRMFKTTLWEYSGHIAVPKKIIEKVPTAGLWTGQTDEKELGMSYKNIDRILLGRELLATQEEIVQANKNPEITLESIARIFDHVERNKFKGEPEPWAELNGGVRYE